MDRVRPSTSNLKIRSCFMPHLLRWFTREMQNYMDELMRFRSKQNESGRNRLENLEYLDEVKRATLDGRKLDDDCLGLCARGDV